MGDNTTQKNNFYNEVAEYAAENVANGIKIEDSTSIPDIDAAKSDTDATKTERMTIRDGDDDDEIHNSTTAPAYDATQNDVDADGGTVDARSDGSMTDSEAANAPSDDSTSLDDEIPDRITASVGESEYALTVLCLCYMMRNLNVGYRYKSIDDIAEIKSRKEIIPLHKKIVKHTLGLKDEEAKEGEILLNKILKLEQPKVLLACESVMSDSVLKPPKTNTSHDSKKNKKQKKQKNRRTKNKPDEALTKKKRYSDHHFKEPIKGWGNIRIDVLVHNEPKYLATFNTEAYIALKEVYPFCKKDGKFYASDAVISIFTDIVLYCFEDIAPDLCIASSGGKSELVRLLDLTKLGLDPTKAIFVDCCARTAIFPMNTHRAFSKLYLNDADKRFYHFLSDMKEHPLHMITGILMLEYDKELITLREEAQKQKIKHDMLTTRQDELLNELKQSPDNPNELKEELKKIQAELKLIHKDSKLKAIKKLMIERCNKHPSSDKKRIGASANLFWWVQMSYCGNFEGGISADRLNPDLSGNRIGKMLSAALVLQKSTISCKDCLEFAEQYMGIEQCLGFNDPPYAGVLGSTDKTYSVRKLDDSKPTGFEDSSKIRYIPNLKPFGIDKIDKIIKLMANSKCMSMLTHSDIFDVRTDCYTEGLYYLFEYDKNFCGNPYTTVVWGNNIKLKDVLRRNDDGSVKSPAYIDTARYERHKARAEHIQQLKAHAEQVKQHSSQIANNSTDANKTIIPAISSDEEV